jgi:23S rRNA (adenine2503-C2)-methyltransferase
VSTHALTRQSRESAAATNLLGLAQDQLAEFFEALGEQPFRARQLMQWVYGQGELDFAAMTTLSKILRQRLADGACLELPAIRHTERSGDGTVKWLLDVGQAQAVETVFIPESRRGTLCISSQAGCALDCAFCATAQQGFNRNLTAAEIIGQVLLANRELGAGADNRWPVSNVVFMGMGEPLANYRNLVPAARILVDDLGFGLSRRRVTVSTAGLVPQLYRLAEDCNVALAVSLHAPTDDLRDELVPINRRHPIAELLDACWHYAAARRTRDITFEYVMLRNVNDSVAQAEQLARLLRGRPAKVNLIPFNSFPGSQFQCASPQAIDRFHACLNRRGVLATVRRTRGDDIAAACGQLAGRVSDRTRVRLGEKMARPRVS